jgi:hypothetical protein
MKLDKVDKSKKIIQQNSLLSSLLEQDAEWFDRDINLAKMSFMLAI